MVIPTIANALEVTNSLFHLQNFTSHFLKSSFSLMKYKLYSNSAIFVFVNFAVSIQYVEFETANLTCVVHNNNCDVVNYLRFSHITLIILFSNVYIR